MTDVSEVKSSGCPPITPVAGSSRCRDVCNSCSPTLSLSTLGEDASLVDEAPGVIAFTTSIGEELTLVLGEQLPNGDALMGSVRAGRVCRFEPSSQSWVVEEEAIARYAVKQLDRVYVRECRTKSGLYVKEDPYSEIAVLQTIEDAGGHPNVLSVVAVKGKG